MKGQHKFVPFLSILLFLLLTAYASAAAVNSCVTCHTNESVMKALYKPPDIPKDAGEG